MNTRRFALPRYSTFLIIIVALLAAACSPASQPAAKSSIVDKLTQALKSATQAVADSAAKAIAAQSTPASPEPGKPSTGLLAKMPRLGEEQTLDDIVVTPLKFEPLTTPGVVQPKAGQRYFAVTLSIENASQLHEFKFDPASLLLANTTGDSYKPVMLKSASDQVEAQTLKPGAQIKGIVVFEVPEKGAEWYLEFKDTANHHVTWSMAG